MRLSANFHDYEFRCKCPCRGLKLHPGFIERAQAARDTVFALTGKGINPLSACRCKRHNDTPASVGGAGGHRNSLHVYDFEQHKGQDGCLAFDCEAADGAYRGALFTALWTNGFSVGWNAQRKFLHGDLRILIGMPQTTFDY